MQTYNTIGSVIRPQVSRSVSTDVFLSPRKQPVLLIVESISRVLMQWFYELNVMAQNPDIDLPPTLKRELVSLLKPARQYQTLILNQNVLKCAAREGKTSTTYVQKHLCTRGQWQQRGCVHKLTAILKKTVGLSAVIRENKVTVHRMKEK